MVLEAEMFPSKPSLLVPSRSDWFKNWPRLTRTEPDLDQFDSTGSEEAFSHRSVWCFYFGVDF